MFKKKINYQQIKKMISIKFYQNLIKDKVKACAHIFSMKFIDKNISNTNS